MSPNYRNIHSWTCLVKHIEEADRCSTQLTTKTNKVSRCRVLVNWAAWKLSCFDDVVLWNIDTHVKFTRDKYKCVSLRRKSCAVVLKLCRIKYIEVIDDIYPGRTHMRTIGDTRRNFQKQPLKVTDKGVALACFDRLKLPKKWRKQVIATCNR